MSETDEGRPEETPEETPEERPQEPERRDFDGLMRATFLKHAADLAFSTLMDSYLDPGVRLFLPDFLDLCRSGLAVIQIDTLL